MTQYNRLIVIANRYIALALVVNFAYQGCLCAKDLEVAITKPLLYTHLKFGTIFPKEIALPVVNQCSRGGYEGEFWVPSIDLVQLLEKNLPKYFEENHINLRHGGLDTYRRQYVGVYINGEKAIYVNAFHSNANIWIKNKTPEYIEIANERRKKKLSKYVDVERLPNDLLTWQHYPISVCDGGQLYFGITFQLKTTRFLNLIFNGQ